MHRYGRGRVKLCTHGARARSTAVPNFNIGSIGDTLDRWKGCWLSLSLLIAFLTMVVYITIEGVS